MNQAFVYDLCTILVLHLWLMHQLGPVFIVHCLALSLNSLCPMIYSIQRAWRRHLERSHDGDASKVSQNDHQMDTESGGQPMSISTSIDSLRNARSEEDLLSELSADQSVKGSRDSLLTSGQEEVPAVSRSLTNKNIIIDADPESNVSDYSEMADCIKEHLANVQIIQKEDLDIENTLQNDALVQQKIFRLPGESDMDYAKRLRKLNFLSLAQEFAALKKVDSDALPFGAHKAQLPSPMSEGSEASDLSSVPTPIEGKKDFVTGKPKGKAKEAWQASDHLSNPGHILKMKNPTHSSQSTDAYHVSSDTSKVSANSEDEPDSESNVITTGSTEDREMSSFEKQHEALSPFKHSKLCAKEGGSSTSGKGDFDVYNMECTLPTVDWDKLEHELQKAAEEERNKKVRNKCIESNIQVKNIEQKNETKGKAK